MARCSFKKFYANGVPRSFRDGCLVLFDDAGNPIRAGVVEGKLVLGDDFAPFPVSSIGQAQVLATLAGVTDPQAAWLPSSRKLASLPYLPRFSASSSALHGNFSASTPHESRQKAAAELNDLAERLQVPAKSLRHLRAFLAAELAADPLLTRKEMRSRLLNRYPALKAFYAPVSRPSTSGRVDPYQALFDASTLAKGRLPTQAGFTHQAALMSVLAPAGSPGLPEPVVAELVQVLTRTRTRDAFEPVSPAHVSHHLAFYDVDATVLDAQSSTPLQNRAVRWASTFYEHLVADAYVSSDDPRGFCHSCRGVCSCSRLKQLVRSFADLNSYSSSHEHRWGTSHARRPTKRLRELASSRTKDTQAAFATSVGEEAVLELTERFGPQFFEHLSLLAVQCGEPADVFLDKTLSSALYQEAKAVHGRVSAVASNYTPAFKELVALSRKEPVQAVFLGRDGIFASWAFEAYVEEGLVPPELSSMYLSASTGVTPGSLQAVREHVDEDRWTVWVDTGFEGKIPLALDAVLYGSRVKHHPTTRSLKHNDRKLHADNAYTPTPEASPAVRPVHEMVEKDPRMRLLTSQFPDRAFSDTWTREEALTVEYEAKHKESSTRAGLSDQGRPTGALEQFFASLAQHTTKEVAQHTARDLKAAGGFVIDDETLASAFFTPETVSSWKTSGRSISELAAAALEGASAPVVEALDLSAPVASVFA